MEEKTFKKLTAEIRKEVVEYAYNTKSTHIGSNFSIIDLLTALYFDFLNVSPDRKFDKDRDRLILSKAHACLGLYIILEKRGFIDKATLDKFAVNGGLLEHHTRRNLEMGIEFSGGSLGHGLGIGAGMALAARKDGLKSRVFVVMSDGEMDEGTTWEAALFSAHNKLDNLVLIVDYNKMQALGKTKEVINIDSLADKFNAFGWNAVNIDGHSYEEISSTFSRLPLENGRPSAIVSNTIKGKGVSFMEMNLLWHYRVPTKDEYEAAVRELENNL